MLVADKLATALRRLIFGNADVVGTQPVVVSVAGVPAAAEADGSLALRDDPANPDEVIYVRAAGAWWPVSAGTGAAEEYVYQPGGVAGGNVYVSWAALVAAAQLQVGPKLVYIDTTFGAAAIPVGAWDFMSPTTLAGPSPQRGDFISGTLTALAIDDGATLVNLAEIRDLALASNSNAALGVIVDPPDGYTLVLSGTTTVTNAGAGPLLRQTLARKVVLWLESAALLTGGSAAVQVAGAGSTLSVVALNGAFVGQNVFAGAAGAANQTGFNASGIITTAQVGWPGGVFAATGRLDASARASYTDAAPLLGTTVTQGAIDVLKARSHEVVANVAAFAALVDAGWPDGKLVWVQSRRCFFSYVAGAVPALLDGWVYATAAGRLVRVDVADPSWNQQAAWYVDSGAGSDDNDGAALTPLASFQEFARRVQRIAIPTAVNIVAMAGTDQLTWQPRWEMDASGAFGSLTVQGVATDGADLAVAASTDEAANQAPTVTVAAKVWTVGTLLRAKATGNTAIVTLDTGAGVAETTPWYTPTNARAAPPAPAALIVEETLPVCAREAMIAAGNGFAPTVSRLTVTAFGFVGGGGRTFTRCRMLSAVGSGIGTVQFTGCALLGAVQCVTNGSRTSLSGSAILAGAADTVVGNGAMLRLLDSIVRGTGSILVGNTGLTGPAGLLRISSLGRYGAAPYGLRMRLNGQAQIDGTFYGAGPAVMCAVDQGGYLHVAAAVTPTATGGAELQLDGAATAVQCVAGAAPGAAVALTTWAEWAAALVAGVSGFNRNVLSYLTGARICNTA